MKSKEDSRSAPDKERDMIALILAGVEVHPKQPPDLDLHRAVAELHLHRLALGELLAAAFALRHVVGRGHEGQKY